MRENTKFSAIPLLVATLLTACAMSPPVLKEKDTVLDDKGNAISRFYGTYKIVKSYNRTRAEMVKFEKTERGNPVLTFYDKNGKKMGLGLSTSICKGYGPTHGWSSLSCGEMYGFLPPDTVAFSMEEDTSKSKNYPNSRFASGVAPLEAVAGQVYLTYAEKDATRGEDYILERIK